MALARRALVACRGHHACPVRCEWQGLLLMGLCACAGVCAWLRRLLGLEKSKELAADLIRQAKEQLSRFDQQKAAPLLGLADFIAYRQN